MEALGKGGSHGGAALECRSSTTEHTDHTEMAIPTMSRQGLSAAGRVSVRDPVTYRVIGAFLGVYRELGWGFLERVYHRAMVVALAEAGASVASEVELPVYFRGTLVGEYRADLIVDGAVVVEIKTAEAISPPHRAQVLNYLKATTYERALLLNFGPRPQFERLLLTKDRKEDRRFRS